MIERKLKPPPGYVGFRVVLCGRAYGPRQKKPKQPTKFEQFVALVKSLGKPFTTCDLPIDKRRSNRYLKDLINDNKVREVDRVRVPGVFKRVILYEVIK